MRTLAWALYLATSWTWCIGMFLPSLLVRDLGIAGYIAFLVPNFIGAGAVGWVLAGRTERFYQSKKPIILAFTAVTVAFHGYWIMWRFDAGVGGVVLEAILGALAGASLVMNAVAATGRVRGLAAGVTILISLGCATVLLAAPASAPLLSGGPLDLAGLTLVCVLGFGLCPYLDITFNKACAESARPRAAFTIGFILFALLLTLVTRGRTSWAGVAPTLSIDNWTIAAVIGAHFGAQTAFTCAAHSEAVRTTARTPLKSAAGLWIVAFPAAIGVALGVLVQFALPAFELWGMASSELGYRGFLTFYGLVFPAWLLLTLGPRPATSARTLRSLAIITVVALPFYVVGFVMLREVWLIPGVALVVALSFALRDPDRLPPPISA
jgi:hypothetical protein